MMYYYQREDEFKMIFLEKNNGITLIALIVTVIILLILAGVSVSSMSGDNRSNTECCKC